MRIISWFAMVVFPPNFSYSVLRGCLGTVELFRSRRRAYHSGPRKMADARPTFPLPQRYTQRKTEAVQPPDDRTYSAEVTAFSAQSPASSQCARRLRLHALDYHTTPHPICQALFLEFFTNFLTAFQPFRRFYFCLPLGGRQRRLPRA